MHRWVGVLVSTCAILVLATSAAAASGGVEFRPSEGELRRLRASGRVTLEVGGLTVECQLQIEFTLNGTISKVPGGPAGQVTEAELERCPTGVWEFLGFPWSLSYIAFSGTLPSITSLRLQLNGTSFLEAIEVIAPGCLYRGGELQVTTSGSPITEMRFDESRGVPLSRVLFGTCPTGWTFKGTLAVTPTVRMTLIGRARSCATPPAVRVDEGFQRQESSNVTIPMTAQVECESTRLDSIRTTRANESIGVSDRERVVGRIFRRGERFRYDLRLTAREGTRTVEETVDIGWTEEGGSGRSTTRVRFTDL